MPLGINGAARHSKAGWNYPKQPTASTLLVLLRLAEPRGPKPPAAEARNVAELVSGHAGSDPQSLIHYLFSKAGRTPGRNGNSQRASGVLRAARGEAFSPRDPKGRKSSVNSSPRFCRVRPVAHPPRGAPRLGDKAGGSKNRAIRSRPIAVRHQRRAATSSDELQPSPCRGGGLRNPKGRRSSAQLSKIRLGTQSFHRSNSVRFVLGGPPRTKVFPNPSQFCPVRAAASGPGIKDAPPQARRFYEPQKHGQQLSPTRRENRNRFSRLKNRRSPKFAPVLGPVSAPLRLRCRSAGAARHSKDGCIYS